MRLKVIVRVRPMSQREKQCGSRNVVAVENCNSLAVTNIKVPEQNAGDSRERVRRFAFDCCFSENASQDQIFETVESIVGRSLRNRCHSCVLTYGQTSSGKTHTMMGFPHDPGLTPRLCRRIFQYFEDGAIGDEASRMKISVSYLEIYNEKVADLLSDQTNKIGNRLKVREHPKRGPYVEGLSEHLVSNDIELLERLESGTAKRRVGFTSTNPESSRSHSVFSVSCDGVKLHLVDLAGNERAGSRGYAPSRFREGANINKSLVALGNVISVLAEHSRPSTRNKFVPYRDSVLTWLLKDTLQGNSETVMIATISPSSTCYSETVNTLRFGQRAKRIVYKPVVIEDPKEKTIRELRAEIAKLRELLTLTQRVNPVTTTLDKQMTSNNSSSPSGDDITPHNEEIDNPSEKDTLEKSESDVQDPQDVSNDSALAKSKTPLSSVGKLESFALTSETLVPTMDVTSSVSPRRSGTLSRMCSFDRTYSVDSENCKTFSSQESLQSPKRTKSTKGSSSTNSRESLPDSIQRRASVSNFSVPSKQNHLALKINKSNPSLNKPNSSLKTITQKRILGNSLKNPEVAELKKVEPKVDTNRKALSKPRSRVVAAVTNRLYSKVIKKEASTSTENALLLKASSPATNARSRLRELTQRALKAYKCRNVETQTDNLPVLRLKEVSTDCDGLKQDLIETKDASTLDKPEIRDAEVECTLLNGFAESDVKNVLVLTRSCGVQATEERCGGVSFTKYLTENQSNPIFTDSVNINISHNYINGNRTHSLSDGSVDMQRHNVSFNTPDLISNHNSLEQHANHNDAAEDNEISDNAKIRFALGDVLDEFEEVETSGETVCVCRAECLTTPQYKYDLTKVDILTAHAAEIHSNIFRECCVPLPNFQPDLVKATLIKTEEFRCYPVIKHQPVLAQATPEFEIFLSSGESSLDQFSDVTDSVPKKAQRAQKSKNKNERLMMAMSNFVEEATTLMKNLTKTANQIDNCSHRHCLEECDIQVTVNDISGLDKFKRRRKKGDRESCSTQTEQPLRESCCSQTSQDFLDFIVPINKYEALLEDSCRRLDEKINKLAHSRSTSVASDDCEDINEHFSRARYNCWDLSNIEVEDSSLESNPVTFSDYGSLPRKTHKRRRTPTCSPSAFLKQLTNMRKEVIESSREELLKNNIK